MVDFGDDLIIQTYKIPWLIWIQFVVMLLLTLAILLNYFALDSSPNAGDSLIFSPPSRLDPLSACSHRTQVSGDHDSRENRPTSTANRTMGLENNSEREGSPTKDLGPAQGSERFIHPCRYFDLAKQAFLKCLGLNSVSRRSYARGQGNED